MWCRYFLLEQDGDAWMIVDDVITLVAERSAPRSAWEA